MEQHTGSKSGKEYIKAAVTICRDFGAQKNKISIVFNVSIVSLPTYSEVVGPDAMILVF